MEFRRGGAALSRHRLLEWSRCLPHGHRGTGAQVSRWRSGGTARRSADSHGHGLASIGNRPPDTTRRPQDARSVGGRGAYVSEEAFHKALQWANEPVSSGARLLEWVEDEGFVAPDPILDQDERTRPVHEAVSARLVERVTSREALAAGVAGYRRGSWQVAE